MSAGGAVTTAGRVALPLNLRAQWQVSTGASGVPLVRAMGAAAILASVAIAVLWCATWLRDAITWGVSSAPLALTALLTALAVWHATRLWRGWMAHKHPITLCWTGLPIKSNRQGQSAANDPAGWGVSLSGSNKQAEPAQVSLVLDLQRWLLIRIETAGPQGKLVVQWAWLDLQQIERVHLSSGGLWGGVHPLRVRLHLPPTEAAGRVLAASCPRETQGMGWVGARAMASSAHLVSSPSGSPLSRTRISSGFDHPPAFSESGWPATVVLAPDEPQGSRRA
jgi:hypothetical protein